MSHDPKPIFEYDDPADKKDGTRWVAAETEEQAERYAQRKGWRKAGGRIFTEGHPCGRDPGALKRMGCDVVLS